MTTFSDLADTKPRIRRDVLFTETPKGVLFHNSKGGFHVNAASAYRLATILVPHLDGSVTLSELAGSAGEQQKTMMASLVGTLLDRGFARDAREDRSADEVGVETAVAQYFAPQIDYITHYVGDAVRRFQTFRTANIAVLGEGETANWAVAGLLRNGAARVATDPKVWSSPQVRGALSELTQAGMSAEHRALDTGGPLTWQDLQGVDIVCPTGQSSASQMHVLTSDTIPEGKVVVPAWTMGGRLVMGPLAEPDSHPLWASVVRALGRDFPTQEAALWHAVANPNTPPATPTPDGPMAAMVGNHLAYEIFRITTGCLPGETVQGVILQDIDSLDVRAERVLADPGLPGVPAPAVIDLSNVTPHDQEYDAQAHEGAAESDPVAIELNARSAMVQRHCGLVATFTDSGWTQVPMKVSTVDFARPGAEPVQLAAASVDHVADARLRLLDAVAIRHASGALLVAGASQQETQIEGGRFVHAAHPGVRCSDWSVPATDLLTGNVTRIPLDAVVPGHAWAANGFGVRPIGWGAAVNLDRATARGLRDALTYAALIDAGNGAAVQSADLTTLTDSAQNRTAAALRFLAEAADLLQVQPEVLITSAPGQACAVAVVRDAHSGHHSIAGGLTAAQATRDALRDLVADVQLRDQGWQGRPCGSQPVDQFDPWTLSGGPTAHEAAPATWREAARRAQIAGYTPVLVRTTTSALIDCGVESAAVLLHRDAQ